MSGLKVGDAFPEGVVFQYVPPTGELDIKACGIAVPYKASEEFKNKKAVIVSVPGAFTPTCQEQHIVSYLQNREALKAKGVDQVIVLASNDHWVMAAWGKANGVADDSILFVTDVDAEFSKSIGWANGPRTGRYAIIVDNGKVVYAEADTVPKSIANSGAEAVLARL
ncbi:peroxiredoxin type-2 [Sporothrix stenoceras]|uniref:Peroxiredoxin type-2 n=1 Tax=Sporothrix stenoceras TaxID=5173 RepID=A0ABR3YS23_9PEZI